MAFGVWLAFLYNTLRFFAYPPVRGQRTYTPQILTIGGAIIYCGGYKGKDHKTFWSVPKLSLANVLKPREICRLWSKVRYTLLKLRSDMNPNLFSHLQRS